MAIRVGNRSDSENNHVKTMPTFREASKMKHYDIFFDKSNDNNPTTGFFKFLSADKIISARSFKFIITAEFEHRMDLISYKFFRTTTRDWIIEAINDIKDPIKDLYVGRVIYIPDSNIIFDLGGIVV